MSSPNYTLSNESLNSIYSNKSHRPIVFENTGSTDTIDFNNSNETQQDKTSVTRDTLLKPIQHFTNVKTNAATNAFSSTSSTGSKDLQEEKLTSHVSCASDNLLRRPSCTNSATSTQSRQACTPNTQSNSSNKLIHCKQSIKTAVEDNIDTKNRCVDRYDSFESSDSGVGTSISCTESNTSITEDTLEPSSPLNSHNASNVDNQLLLPNAIKLVSHPHEIMSPQMLKESNPNINTKLPEGLQAVPFYLTNQNAKKNLPREISPMRKDDKKDCGTAALNNKQFPALDWPWNTIVTNMATTSNSVLPKKRLASELTELGEHGYSKKIRKCGIGLLALTGGDEQCPTNTAGSTVHNCNNISKRLKTAALEESQTKITGYFKSQIKSHISPSNGTSKQLSTVKSNNCPTKVNNLNPTESGALALNAPATTASLNKYFNIFEHLKETNQEYGKVKGRRTNEFDNDAFNAAQKKHSTPKANVPTAQLCRNISVSPMAIPALKKIERAKPTKIAQVAPNLRKTPSSNNNYNGQNGTSGKSPVKKHVAIAPRTPEMKQQQLTVKPSTVRTLPANAAAQQMTAHLQSSTQQPTVLLTTFRIPSTQQAPAKQSLQATNLTSSAAAQSRLSSADPSLVGANPSTTTTVYQLPVQLPNLIQIPQILTTESANIQFNNLGTDGAVGKIATTATTTSEAQAAQAAASQYSCFLNGTVFKLQQFTTATTTTATSSSAVGAATTTNPFNLLNSSDLQDFILKQQHEQHQKAAVTSTSFQEIFQQQIAAAIAANQQQGQQLQRISNHTNIQHPVVMATPTGLLLNTASLPTMLAQAAAVIAVNNQQQKAIAVPALQPIQQNQLPALSPIFTPQSQDTEQCDLQRHQVQQYAHNAQQQFISAGSIQPPPLSSVTLSNLSQLQPLLQKQSQATTTKLTIVKAKTTSSVGGFPALSSQPPPLVTISSSKVRPKTNATSLKSPVSPTPVLSSAAIIQMPLTINKTCPNRITKMLSSDPKQLNLIENKKNQHNKIGMSGGKIIATSTTPPPLIPRLLTSLKSLSTAPKQCVIGSNKTMMEGKPPTAGLVLTNGFTTNKTLKTSPNHFKSTCVKSESVVTTESNDCISKSLNLKHFTSERHLTIESNKTGIYKSSNEHFDLLKNCKKPCNDAYQSSSPSSSSSSLLNTLYQPSLSLATTYTHKAKDANKEEIKEDIEVVASSAKAKDSNHLQHSEVKEEVKLHDGTDVNETEKLHLENSSSSFASIANSMCGTDTLLEAATSISRSSSETPSSTNYQADSSSNVGLHTLTVSDNTESSPKHGLSDSVELTCSSSNSTQSDIKSDISAASLLKAEDFDLQSKEEIVKEIPKVALIESLNKNDALETFPKFDVSTIMSNKPLESSEAGQLNALISLSKSSPDLLESLRITSAKNISIQTNLTAVDTKLSEITSFKKSAISPILSQPKIIRFPAESGFRLGTKSGKRHDGVCYWDKCNKKHDSNSKLLDHMQTQHVNMQTGPFCCLWVGCKVYNRESCSRRWLERHVLSHGGSKQFKCIVDGCGLRFGSQLALQKHVNNHFSTTETKDSTNKRTSDPPVPKQLRKNGKKLRYRRQPFSARMFDFFDAGIMEALQHRLRQISTLTNSCNAITFRGNCIMRRKTFKGTFECFIRWTPGEIIADEWLPESTEPYIKKMKINEMDAAEKNRIDNLLMSAYSLPYSPNLFENDTSLSAQRQSFDTDINEMSTVMENAVKDNANGNGKEADDDSYIEYYDTYLLNTYASGMLSVSNIKKTRKPQRRFLTSR